MSIFQHNSHSVFYLSYHLILVVKHRKKFINNDISKRLNEIFNNISLKYGISCEEWIYHVDYVYIKFNAQPKSELSKFINAYKSASSRLIKKEFLLDNQKNFWNQSFCLFSTGNISDELIKKYISEQEYKN